MNRLTLQFATDANGNKVLRVKVDGFRRFSIQTNGNLPQTHREHEVTVENFHNPIWHETCEYIRQYGTQHQRRACYYTL